jgi:inosose dehydratase
MQVASAPVSWGITEIKGLLSDLPYSRVMDEIRDAGYQGTELGPWGFYPHAPRELRFALDARGLALVGSFVDVPIHDAALFDEGRRALQQVLPLLASFAATGATSTAPVLILSARQTPKRAAIAGRVNESAELSASQWKTAGAYLRELAHMGRNMGLEATFHHHAGTYIETPAEIDRLFEEVDPSLLGLCLDTGHLVLGGGDNLQFLSRYAALVRHVHLKNIDPGVLARVRAGNMNYLQAVQAGVFAPLATGSIDIPGVVALLRTSGYDGWLVVEQDIDLSRADHPDPLSGARAARTFIRETMGV